MTSNAWHEAGHVVAAYALGLPVLDAVVYDEPGPDRPHAGVVRTLVPECPSVLHSRTVMTLAGPSAEALVVRRQGGTTPDFAEARRLAEAAVVGPERAAVRMYLRYARREADALVRRHVEAVRAVAACLAASVNVPVLDEVLRSVVAAHGVEVR